MICRETRRPNGWVRLAKGGRATEWEQTRQMLVVVEEDQTDVESGKMQMRPGKMSVPVAGLFGVPG